MINYNQSYFAKPYLEDALVQALRIKFGSLTWVDYCLHSVVRMSDNKGIEWGFFKLNQNENNEQIIAPDSHVESMIFFEVNSVDYNNNIGELSKFNISLYCWFNKSKIDATTNEDVTNKYAKICYDILKNNFRSENISKELKRDNIFDFEGLKTNNYKPIIGKFGGFKLIFDIYHDINTCYNISNMSTARPIADSGTFTASNLVAGILTITHLCNSMTILSITINKANGEIITVMPNEIVSLSVIKVDLGGIEVGTHTWTVTAKPMLI